MTAIELPDSDTSVRCTDFSHQIRLDPGGTAFAVDEIIVADVPLPWPKPLFALDGMAGVPGWVDRARENGRTVRVLGAVPVDGDGRVVVHRRTRSGDARLGRVEHRVDPSLIPDLLRSLLVDGLDSVPQTEVEVGAPASEVLICTQGSHDLCCGSIGTRFALEIQSARPDVSVRRVSHTGGHRFAPTGLTLPDGRMWGLLTIDQMLGVLDRSMRPASVADRCRGWTGAAMGPAQVAERAVFALVDDWEFDDGPRQVEVTAESEEESRVLVGGSDRWWEVEVSVAREVPTIKCGAPGGVAGEVGTGVPGRRRPCGELTASGGVKSPAGTV